MLRTIEFLGHHISKNEIVFDGTAILSQQDDKEENDLGHGGRKMGACSKYAKFG